jgi:hypothetical protein
MKPLYFSAEKTAHPNAAGHRWAIVYDPTPGGKPIEGGGRSFSLRFPVLLLTDYVGEPETVAASVAGALNEARWREEEAKSEVPA